ncbi:hypothetical protein N9W44_02955 [Alphaproteobacteria bacterium]|jgi:hypothetical protein|nr:hypothetical protein [Alphaproteobacteria bacterium]
MKDFLIIIVMASSLVVFGLGGWWVYDSGILKPKPKPLVQATIILDNRCELLDEVFVVSAPQIGRTTPFYNKRALFKLPEGTLLQLATSSLYPDVAYDGIPQKIEPEMTLIADCSLTPRLEGIFGSMRDTFTKE